MKKNIISKKSAFFYLFPVVFFLWSGHLSISIVLIGLVYFSDKKSLGNFLLKGINRNILSIMRVIYFCFMSWFLITIFRMYFFDIYRVSSSSMEKTLLVGDYVLVNKFYYGSNIPNCSIDWFWSNLNKREYTRPFYKFSSFTKDFSREDKVVFKSLDDSKNLVKRIIGMPGDTLEIKNSRVLVNNNPLTERSTYSHIYFEKNRPNSKKTRIYSNEEIIKLKNDSLVRLIHKKDGTSVKLKNSSTLDNYGLIIIPNEGSTIFISKDKQDFYRDILTKFEQKNNIKIEHTFINDYFFLLGDNRHNSVDSRHFGLIPRNHIMGKVIFSFRLNAK
ncbi:signal peptidase I [Maribacter sp.]|nr:signal peptidase I [Maribacter sp.]